MAALLRVSNLRTHYFSFGGARVVKAVDDVSFTLGEGETIGLVGESGCGKTTTCLSIVGLLPSAARVVGGSIEFAGEEITTKRPREMRRMREYPHQMSGGMRQRVVGAIAMAGGPKLMIADEPTTNLDVTIQAQYLEVLKDIQQQSGVALIFVTHNLGIVARMCDKMAVMYAGKIVEQGSVRDLFRSP